MGILDNAIPATEIHSEFKKANILTVGPSGAGKSRLWATYPGRVLNIDLDQRGDTFAGLPNVEVIPLGEADPKSPKAWTDLELARKEIWSQVRRNKFPYDLVTVSSLTTMNRAAMNWSLTLNPKRGFGGGPTEAHYGPHGTAIAQFLMSMVGLPVSFGIEAHYNIIEDNEKAIFKYIPKVWGKMLRTEVPTFFSEVWFMEKEEKAKKGNIVHQLYTSYAEHFGSCKSAINSEGKYWSDPQTIDLTESPCGIAKLLEMRFGKEKKDELCTGTE